MKKIHFLLVVLFISGLSFSQKIENVHAEQQGKQVVITYDITGSQSNQKFDVKLLYSQNGYDWKQAINGLTGDIGNNVSSGTNKSITWTVLQNVDRLVGTGYMFKVKAVTIGGGFTSTSSIFTDNRDGKTYKWVKIGTQTWMAENLNYQTGSGSWCYENNDNNCKIYGRLYDWETAKTACPNGWHLPSDDEWAALKKFLGDYEIGGKMKQSGTSKWKSPNASATNSCGFNALPGGKRGISGSFSGLGTNADFWSSTEIDTNNAVELYLGHNVGSAGRSQFKKAMGFSVRCLQDK